MSFIDIAAILLIMAAASAYIIYRYLDLPYTIGLTLAGLVTAIAVLGVMKSQNVPRGLQIKVAGESLFNDGIGVVAFTLLLAGAGGHGTHGGGVSATAVATLLLQEVGGGILLGLVSGYLVFRLMRGVDEADLEILLSVALVMGIAFIAFRLHLSAPLACVVAGLFIGNHGRRFAMSPATRTSLDGVWSFLDQSLNGILFLLVGLEVVATLSPQTAHLLAGCLLLALALSLPPFPGRAAVVTATSIIVAFSVVIQGLTIGPLIHRQMERNRTAV